MVFSLFGVQYQCIDDIGCCVKLGYPDFGMVVLFLTFICLCGMLFQTRLLYTNPGSRSYVNWHWALEPDVKAEVAV